MKRSNPAPNAVAAIADRDGLVFRKGVLVEVIATRKVARKLLAAAAVAPEWSSVKKVTFDHGVPRWFVTEWIRNPAVSSVERFHIATTLRIVRRGARWHVTYDRRTTTNNRTLKAFAAGLPTPERERFLRDEFRPL